MKVRVEMANGEKFNFDKRVRDIAKTQDLAAWKRHEPRAFGKWMQDTMAGIMGRLDFVIVEK